METTRRDFIVTIIKGAALAALPIGALKFLSPSEVMAAIKETNVLWGFVVDTYKCVGCGFCVKACKLENDVPYDLPVSRTWVERYVILKDGRVLIDSHMAGRDGFTSQNVRETEVN